MTPDVVLGDGFELGSRAAWGRAAPCLSRMAQLSSTGAPSLPT